MNIGSSSTVDGMISRDRPAPTTVHEQREQHEEDQGRAVGDRHLPPQAQGPAAPGAQRRRRHGDLPDVVKVSGGPGGRPIGLPYGARAERGLTSRTPEQISSRQLAGADPGAADQARLPGTAVDVDLAAVVVHPRRAAHRLGRVLGRTVSIRPVRTPSSISSTRSSHIARNWPTRRVLAGPQRVDPVPEQDLGAVDVADAGEHRLVHAAGRRSAGGCARIRCPGPLGSASGRSGSGPSAAEHRVALLAADRSHWWRRGGRRTSSRSAAAAAPGPTGRAGRCRRARRTCRSGPRCTCTKRSPGELHEQVLARRLGAAARSGRRAARRRRRTGPAGCSPGPAARRRPRRASSASRRRVWPSGIVARPARTPGSGGRSPVVS